ncbi:MAG: hypothetical protein HOO06_02565 [Bdellovibrionaceae bacterium]|jgi:hypothetical protein|nr:hypothetical protein [Pseudobdellovibrionaceae bacterium]
MNFELFTLKASLLITVNALFIILTVVYPKLLSARDLPTVTSSKKLSLVVSDQIDLATGVRNMEVPSEDEFGKLKLIMGDYLLETTKNLEMINLVFTPQVKFKKLSEKRGYAISIAINSTNLEDAINYFSLEQGKLAVAKRLYNEIIGVSPPSSYEYLEIISNLRGHIKKLGDEHWVNSLAFVPEFVKYIAGKYPSDPLVKEDGFDPTTLNCHATTGQFFKGIFPKNWGFSQNFLKLVRRNWEPEKISELEVAGMGLANKNYLMALIEMQYCSLGSVNSDLINWQLGDILYNSTRDHSARVLFKDQTGVIWVFDKANSKINQPWRIRPFAEAFSPGPRQGEGFELTKIFRKCD